MPIVKFYVRKADMKLVARIKSKQQFLARALRHPDLMEDNAIRVPPDSTVVPGGKISTSKSTQPDKPLQVNPKSHNYAKEKADEVSYEPPTETA